MHRLRRPVRVSLQTHRRLGLTTPAVAIALLVIMMGLALIVDRIWLETAKLEMQTAAEAAALAAAQELACDDLLMPNFQVETLLDNARQSAAWIASQNYACGLPVILNTEPEGDVRIGQLVQESQGILFQESTTNPTTVVVTPIRTRFNNNPVALLMAGSFGISFGDVVARAEATIENDVVGVRTSEGAPVPAIPIAILKVDPTGQRSDTWDNLIESSKGADIYSYDPETHTIVQVSDGIPEMVIQSLRMGGKTTDANMLLLDIGTGRNNTEVSRQFESGLSVDDLEAFDGDLWVGQGATISLTATPDLDAAQLADFRAMIGECRICFLYSGADAQRQSPLVTATCSDLVAVRIMAVNGNTDGSCDVTVQPTVMTTRTALLASEINSTTAFSAMDPFAGSSANTLSSNNATTASNIVPNRYIYKLRLTY